MAYIWPIALIILSNLVYQTCTKTVPGNMHPMASLTITYAVGAVMCLILYFVMDRDANLFREYSKLNAAPVVLGIAIVGLEFGYISAYKAGWPVSTCFIVQAAVVAVALIGVGRVLFKEGITLNKVIGALICLVGLYFINK